ncbi:hypothetical protein HQ590_06935 [bacterium]|nr:hypothetical protein [bacterium]
MKLPFLFLAGLLAVAAAGEAAPQTDQSAGRTVAAAYFEAGVTGDVEQADALVAAPFFFDRKEVLPTKDSIVAKHRAMIGHQGQRKVPAYEVSVPQNAVELDRAVFPEYVVFRITITGGGDGAAIDIYVTKNWPPKVIGFSH